MNAYDIQNAYRSGGTKNPYASKISDYYNTQIAQMQSANANLLNAKNGNTDKVQDQLQINANNQSIQGYKDSAMQVNNLSQQYQQALNSQSLGMQNAKKYLGSQLQAQGLGQVGASESSINGIVTAYRNNIANLQNNYNDNITNIENARQKNQTEIDTNLGNKQVELGEEKIKDLNNALGNAQSLKDLERIKSLYGNVGDLNTQNAIVYKQSELARQEATKELEKVINDGKDSSENINSIVEKYKQYLSPEDLEDLEDTTSNYNLGSELESLGGDINNDGNITLNTNSNGATISKGLGVVQGKDQSNYAQSIIDNISNANGKYVIMNYGNTSKDYAYLVKGNNMYKIKITSSNFDTIKNNLYIPDGYMQSNVNKGYNQIQVRKK